MTRWYADGSFYVTALVAIALLPGGCVAPNPPITAPTPQVIIQGDTPGREEVQAIELDNCNGKGDAKRTESRSRSVESSISAEVAAKFGASAEVLSAEVQATVGAAIGQRDERSTSIELVAPPGTRMAFQLVWIGNEQVGIVQNLRASNMPIAFQSFRPTDVRIKSQYDIGCPTSETNPAIVSPTAVVPSPPTRSPAIAAPASIESKRICPLIVIEGSIGGLPIIQTKTWADLTRQGTTEEPQSTNINDACSRVSGNKVQVWVGYWNRDPGYLDFRKTMTVEEAISLIEQNPGQPAIIVPWGE